MNCKDCPYPKYRDITDFCHFNSKCSEEDTLPDCYLLDKRYLLKYMCSGGNSNIYKAYDLHTNKMVAVKECYIKGCYYGRDIITGVLIPDPSSTERLSKKLKLFVKEAEKLNELDCIALFPKMYHIIKLDEYNIFLVMELLSKTSIFEAEIKNSGELLKFFRPLVEGLEEMHRRHIIHRDLNSRNLLLVNGKIKLIDLGIAKRINTDQISTEIFETTVAPYMPKEHQEHQLQDSRTDVYLLAKVIIEAYEKFEIPIPDKVRQILEKASDEKIQNRYDIETFRLKMYGKVKRSKKIFRMIAFLAVCVGLIITLCYLQSPQRNETQQETLNWENNEEIIDNELMEEMINMIQESCKYNIDERYVICTDFDADGKKEMFAFVPAEVDESISYYEDEYDWINYGEVWFCDGERTILVDQIGRDDWQGGGHYDISLLQFGKVYHMQLCKFYEPVTLSYGPVNVYAYENGIPVKTYEGFINNAPMIDGGEDYGVYYSSSALKGSTQLTGQTWDKIYVYYKDGEYLAYESEYLEISELRKYDNFEDAVIEGIKRIYLTKYSSFDEKKLKIITDVEEIDNKLVYVYECEYGDELQYITLFNSYMNESGRIYLNITDWNSRNDYLNSTIWSDDEWHNIYKAPVESDPDIEYKGIGYNYYIVLKNHKTVLEVEEVNAGFWEEYY